MHEQQTMDSRNLLATLRPLLPEHKQTVLALQTHICAAFSASLNTITALVSASNEQSSASPQQQAIFSKMQRAAQEGLSNISAWLALCQTYLTAAANPVSTTELEFTCLLAVPTLLVDDNQQRRTAFQLFLKNLGVACTDVAFEQALPTLQNSLQSKTTYQIVIICGEHFDHHTAYLGRTIKANPHYQHIMPVLALVAPKLLDFEVERALFGGFNCVLNQTQATDFSKKLLAAWRGWISKRAFKLDSVQPAYILIVEDEPIAQFSAQRQLTALGFAVDIAPDGQSALRLFDAKKYALIFMDIGLPDMSGLEITAEMRRREQSKLNTPIIGLTVSALAENEQQGLKIGMNDYLKKPLSPSRLQEILQKWL